MEACAFELYEGEHAMVAGNPRSGKSSLLVAFARLVSRARAAAEQSVSAALASGDATAAENARMDAAEVPEVWAVFDQRSGLVNAPEGVFDRVFESKNASAQVQAALQDAAGPVLLLIDDGDRVDDPMNVFDAIVKGDFPGRMVEALADQFAELATGVLGFLSGDTVHERNLRPNDQS